MESVCCEPSCLVILFALIYLSSLRTDGALCASLIMFKAMSYSLRQCGDIMSSSIKEVLFLTILLAFIELERLVNVLDIFVGFQLNFTCLSSIINLTFYVLYSDYTLHYQESQLISKLSLKITETSNQL